MKMHMFPASSRVTAIVALKFHLSLDWETVVVDLGRGDQRVPGYLINPNQKMPTLEDDGLVLWESNAILVYLASKHPESGIWPSGLKEQADVLRWLFWECAHWDAGRSVWLSMKSARKECLASARPTQLLLRVESRIWALRRGAQRLVKRKDVACR